MKRRAALKAELVQAWNDLTVDEKLAMLKSVPNLYWRLAWFIAREGNR